MSIVRLNSAYKDYIWGGDTLIRKFNKKYDGEILAESWELSCHKDGSSTIASGEYTGKTLVEYIEAKGGEILGKNSNAFECFPILIKLIDVKNDMSIQVHPGDEFALKNEGQYGKTEVWYIVDCKEDSFLYYGFNREITKEEFRSRIEDNTILEVLKKQPVKKGEIYFVEAGTLHAIGKGIVVAEIQQNSNVTYRVYDFNRTSVSGTKRELHIDKAVEVTKREVIKKEENNSKHLISCKYFTVDKVLLDSKTDSFIGNADEKSFVSLLIIDGEGQIKTKDESMDYIKGDSFFIDANNGKYEIIGDGEIIVTTV